MFGKKVAAASMAAFVTAGMLGGCAELQPAPIDRTRHSEEVAGATNEIPQNHETTPNRFEAADENDTADGLSRRLRDAEDAETRKQTQEADETDADVKDGDERESLSEKSDPSEAPRSLETSSGSSESDGTTSGKSERFLSFRYDLVSPEYPVSAESNTYSPLYCISYLPAVTAIGDEAAYAVELSVTYESEETGSGASGTHDEAVWLSDSIRREVVRLVSAGVTDKGDLEDALMESVEGKKAQRAKADGRPVVTRIDVYNVFEVDPVLSYDETDTRVTYVPRLRDE